MRHVRLCVVFTILFAALMTLSCSSLRNPLSKETPELFPIQQNHQKWGYINRKGEVVVQPQFSKALFFSEGLAVACIESNKCGYIDKTGKFVINPQFQEASRFSEGLAAVEVEDRIGYIDKTGKRVINPQFTPSYPFALHAFSEGLARVKVGEKFGFIDNSGKLVINPQFEDASPFFDGLAAASIGNKYGFVDKEGKIVINPQFDDAQPFINGLAAVSVGKQVGYVDKDGKIAINPQFDRAFPFSDEGLARVVINSKVGFINKSGKYEINPQFETQPIRWDFEFEITSDIGQISFSEGLAPVQVSKGNVGYIDKSGKFVINPQFNEAFPFYGGGMALIVLADSSLSMAWIDKEGKYVWRERKEEARITSNANANNATMNMNAANMNFAVITNDNSSMNSSGATMTNSNMSMSNSSGNEKTGRLTMDTNLRSGSNKDMSSLGIHFRGAKVRILDQTSYESEGQTSTWYKIKVYDYGCSTNTNLGCGKNTPNDTDEGWVNAKNVLIN